MKIDLLENVSTLTTIPTRKLSTLIEKIKLCLSHEIFVGSQLDEQVFEINVGVGELIITNNKDNISYNFIPNSEFESLLINSIDGEDSLANYLGDALSSRLLDTYKDV